MKSIPNKTTSLKDNNGQEVVPMTYGGLIKAVINQPKQGGFDYNDIETRLAISKAIKDNPENIELEDSQFNYLKKLVETMKWAVFNEDLLTFKDDILSVK